MRTQIILASNSPRRSFILKKFGIPFVSKTPCREVKEYNKVDIYEFAVSAAMSKIICYEPIPGHIIAGFDTVVYINKKILEKPVSGRDARNMLGLLSGRKHRVITGFAILTDNGEYIREYDETEVEFYKLGADEIEAIMTTDNPMDKAGAYAAQGISSLFIRSINGSFYNVMGLPVEKFYQVLKKLNKFAL